MSVVMKLSIYIYISQALISSVTEALPMFTLNDDRKIPRLCYGTWLTRSEAKERSSNRKGDLTLMAVEMAIELGYRHFDVSPRYGKAVNEQLKTAIVNKILYKVVKRSEIFYTLKLPNYAHTERTMMKLINSELNFPYIQYIDLLLMHWPFAMDPSDDHIDDNIDYLSTWELMIDLRSEGLVKSIGLVNFNISQIDRLIRKTGVIPAVLQIEINLTGINSQLLEYCESLNIVVMGYSVMGAVFREERDFLLPPPKYNDTTLVDIANTYDKTIPQIILRYISQLGVIPMFKSTNPLLMRQNIQIFNFKLQPEDIQKLLRFDLGYLLHPQPGSVDRKYYPFYDYMKNIDKMISRLKRWDDDYYSDGMQYPLDILI